MLIGALLALPFGLGGWALAESLAADTAATRALTMAEGYEQARFAFSSLASRGSGARGADDSFRLAANRAGAALRRIEGTDGAQQTLREQILRSLREYARITAQLTAVREQGVSGPKTRTLSRRAAFLATTITRRLSVAMRQYRTLALESMQSGRRSDGLVLLSALALAALAPFVLIRSASRRRSEREQTERERQRLLRDAVTDNLTGLRNHRAFQEDLGRELERRNRSGGALSLMMIDLDGLKQVNDASGHQAGDELIRCLAECLRETMRSSELAYRVGGDEFTVVLPGCRAWDAFEFAQRLRARVIAKSIGVAIGVTETVTYELKDAVVRRADLALIDAKHSNRNTVIFSDDLEPRTSATSGNAAERYSKVLATALARAVDAKDRTTRNHCETVSELCVRIGSELRLGQERLGKLRLAGLLHDVGKIGIADAILQKPGPLDLAETAFMRTHTQIGYDIMTAAELHEEAVFVLHHHERIDGRGYPQGLVGDAIPLESRIILVSDTFEAITSTRPYRERRDHGAALRELAQHAGTQFDLACVRALYRALGVEEPQESQAGATVTPLRPALTA